MNKRKWMIIVLCAAVLLLIGLHQYYVYIQTPVWNEENKASRIALQESDLAEVTAVQKSVWEDVYWVVSGQNEQKQNMFVWVNRDGTTVHAELQSDGVAKEEVERSVKSRYPGVEIVCIVPGVWEGQYVWEVFYKRKDDSGEQRYYYDFYRFASGELLTTYTLPKR